MTEIDNKTLTDAYKIVLKKEKMKVKHLDWKFNALYTAIDDISEAHFIHFFLKDKLPQGGENIKQLIDQMEL